MAGRLWLLVIVVSCAIGLYGIRQYHTTQPIIAIPALTGDAVFVRNRMGTRILIDTGNDAPALLAFLGQHASLLHRHIVDFVIITNPDTSATGSLASLVTHGVPHMVWTPASTDYGRTFCAHYPHLQCTFLHTGDTWQLAELDFQVVAPQAITISWPAGVILVCHTPCAEDLSTLPTLPDHGMVGLVYPWRAHPDATLWHAWPSHFVAYSDGYRPKHPALLSMAQRRFGHEQLLHEDLDGTLLVPLTEPATLFRSIKDDS